MNLELKFVALLFKGINENCYSVFFMIDNKKVQKIIFIRSP